jgi:hypothetical protein
MPGGQREVKQAGHNTSSAAPQKLEILENVPIYGLIAYNCALPGPVARRAASQVS